MKKKLIALLFGASSLTLGGDALTNNIPVVESKEVAIAGELVKVKEVNNVVEAEFSWKDATPIKVSYDQGKPTLTEKVKDKRDASVITETVTDFEGGFKVDILLDKIPDSNIFCYTIAGAENYDFFYQPPLTAEEIAEGANRPPEIDGSYAVYHKTLANHRIGGENYATGKVMHIPRPQVWSLLDVDTKVWADMQYDNGQLCVTVPQDFLDKAKYPVRVDPTFGYTSIGASGQSHGGAVASGPEVSPANGTITQITAYGYNPYGGSVVLPGAIYSDSSGVPNSLLVENKTTGDSVPNTLAWYNVPLSLSITASTSYWLTISASYFIYYMDTVSGYDRRRQTGVFDSTWTNLSTTTSKRVSVYATYTESGGGATSTAQTEFWFD